MSIVHCVLFQVTETMTDTTRSSGMSNASSPSETNPASRYSDYSGCDGYLTARSSAATTRGATEESECFGDVSSTEVVSERGVASSALVTSKRNVHSSTDGRGRACSSSSMLQSAEVDMSDADVTVKRRRVTDTGLSEDDSQVNACATWW